MFDLTHLDREGLVSLINEAEAALASMDYDEWQPSWGYCEVFDSLDDASRWMGLWAATGAMRIEVYATRDYVKYFNFQHPPGRIKSADAGIYCVVLCDGVDAFLANWSPELELI